MRAPVWWIWSDKSGLNKRREMARMEKKKEDRRKENLAALEKGGIANFYTPENAVEAFSFLAAYRKNQKWLLEVPPSQPL